MTARTSTYPLRLPVSIKSEAEKLAASEGTSLNQFVATAVAEKVAAFYGQLLRRAPGPCRLGGVRPAHGSLRRGAAACRRRAAGERR